MDDEDEYDTANAPVEMMLINALIRVQQSAEMVDQTCDMAIDKLRGSMGIRMPGVKRRIEADLNHMIEELTMILKFIDMKTSYKRTSSGSIKLELPPLDKDKDPRSD